MEQYISKSALVAEIEKLKLCTMDEHMNFYSEAAEGEYHALSNLESFIDTLEVKDDVDTIHPIEDVVSNDILANSLEISRHENSHNGETLDEAAKNHKSAIHIVSPQWTSEVEKAFKAGAEWQKEHMIGKACEWLEEQD